MARPGIVQQAYGELDRLSRKRYGIPGNVLLQKLEQGESSDRGDQVSSAGARGWFQFMPGTRRTVLRDFGLDPWRSEKEARDAAVLHLTGYLGNAKGLEGYNPGGGEAYVKYILGQKVSGNPSYTPQATGHGTPAPAAPDPGLSLAQTLQRPSPVVTAPQAPAFAAQVQQPQGYTPPPGIEQNPQPDLRQQLMDTLRQPAPYAPSTAPASPPAPSSTLPSTGKSLLSPGGGWGGTARLVAQGRLRVARGFNVTGKRSPDQNTAVGGSPTSDHLTTNRNAYAEDYSNGNGSEDDAKARLFQQLGQFYGVPVKKNSYDSGGVIRVGKRRFKVQILYGSGIDHADHVHVGIHAL